MLASWMRLGPIKKSDNYLLPIIQTPRACIVGLDMDLMVSHTAAGAIWGMCTCILLKQGIDT